MSGDESASNDIVSERETQFIPRSDDDEVLWEVQEITAERGRKYKVKWLGIDPATGKPWAQSWVAKHDCTDKLVAEWKAKKNSKKRRVTGKKHGDIGRTSTAAASRASGSSKRAGSSTSGKKTRPLTSETTSSRFDSVKQSLSPPPKKLTSKRKRKTDENPATTSGGDAVQADEGELSRARKKQRVVLETLLPPMSSDDDEVGIDLLQLETPRTKAALQKKTPPKSNGILLDASDAEDSSPPKVRGKSVGRSDARSTSVGVSLRMSDLREGSGLPHSKAKAKVVPRRKGCVADADTLSAVSEDEELRPSKSKKMSMRRRVSPPEEDDDPPEKDEVESAVSRIKVGPPRGVKRREVSRVSETSTKLKSSCTRRREDDSDRERVPGEKPERQPGKQASFFGSPILTRQDAVDGPASTSAPPHMSTPQVLPSTLPFCPDLSPGARARLELFDRMIADPSQPDATPAPVDIPDHLPGDARFNYDDNYGTHDYPDAFDPPHPISPPPSRSKPKRSKVGTPNGLVVPETESSGNSQSQSQSLLKPRPSPKLPPARDQSPRKPIDLPTISVVAASATPSSVSLQDLNLLPPTQRLPPHLGRPSKKQTFKPVPQISPNTFRSTVNVRSHVADSEAPPSSIESFASPKRVDKGKQRAIEGDRLQSSLSEGEGDNSRWKRLVQKRITDSELKKRGKELFDQAQLTREVERQQKKKARRLKPVDDIVNGTMSPQSKGSLLPVVGEAENVLEMQWEDLADLSGGANSTTLDTPEHSEAKPLSKERRERLRIELRQEEEESTQEAMRPHPLPPVGESAVVDTPMPPPRSSKNSFGGQIEDVDHVEQPSTDLQQVSVIVQASQERRHEDTDIEPLPTNPPISSPARPIPENLTDSPRRRLGEALSLLNVKSEEIQRLECELADGRKNLQGLKVELADLQQSTEPTGPVLAAWEAERAQWAQERSKWENDFSVWQTQIKGMSEERASLSARVAELSDAVVRAEEVRAKLSDLEVERDTWAKERDAMLNMAHVRSEELAALTKVRGECNQDRLEWEAERASRVEEKVAWEAERAALCEKQAALLRSVDELTVEVKSVTAAKVSTEKDRDFFREQYAQASGFVGSVREENTELEKRVKIAEGQAQEGVATIKAFFEGRIRALQADVDRWKGLTELLQEKDRRTNDELRIQAAQAPELRDLCDRLDAENKSVKINVWKLEQAQQRSVIRRKKLYCEIFALKKERMSLRSKLSQLVKVADSNAQETSLSASAPPILEYPENMDPNDAETPPDPTPGWLDVSFDEPMLFPCLWRPQWRDQCQQVFDSREDLERHLQEHFRDLVIQ